MSVVDDIKSRLDVVEVISGYVPLKKAGRTYKALCPFHTEKTPSFVVFPETGTWRCFGACQTGGDLFAFVQKQANLDFGEALALLAERAGVELHPHGKAASAEEQRKEEGRTVLAAAAAYYHRLLLTSPQAEAARTYLAGRGVPDEIVERFHLGYAPPAWEAARRALMGEGYEVEDLEAVGLLSQGQEGKGPYDRFRDRLMIPIKDVQGHVVGFGARALKADQQPKYLNSPQTVLFDKSHLLFGIDGAKEAIRENGLAVIVEGYMDVLAAHQYGYRNVVASMGTALTEAQLGQLTRYAHKIVLALDADEAGMQATLRVMDVARNAGLLRGEGRKKTALFVLSLPTDQDPDNVIRADPARWGTLVFNAQPIVDVYFDLVTGKLDMESVQGRAEAAQQLAPIVGVVADPVERDDYAQRLARLTGASERIMGEVVDQAYQRGKNARRDRPQAATGLRPSTLRSPTRREEYILALLLRGQMPISQLQNALFNLEMAELAMDDFSEGEHREIFHVLESTVADDGSEIEEDGLIEALKRHLATTIHPYLEELTRLSEGLPTVSDEAAIKDLIDTALRLRMDNLERNLSGLRYLLEDAREGDDPEAIDQYSQLIRHKSAERDRLEKTLYARTFIGRRRTPVGVM